MNKGGWRYGAKITCRWQAWMYLYTDFYELSPINVCGLFILLHKEQLFKMKQKYFKGMYSLPKRGKGLPCSSAIHS